MKRKMRHLKRKIPNLKDNLPLAINLFLFPFLWSFFVSFHLKLWLLWVPLFGFFFVIFYHCANLCQLKSYLNSKIVLSLNGVIGSLVILSFFLTLWDPLNLAPYRESYYLFFVGSAAGVLGKTFLRKKSVYPLLFLSGTTLFLASLNVFVFVGYTLGNFISADIYGKQRDTLSEIQAVAAGNAIFTAVLSGYWLLVEPVGLWKTLIYYPLSVVFETFLLFGFQKLLDLLPYMYSDEKLEKLANLSNPLIEEMMLRAPGTYHHSVMVSLLSETLARKLGADPLLTRVGAMFHDIGKLINPHYFIENVNGENPHKNLKPEVSATIIKNHVEEGLKLAKKYNLPEEVTQFIPEHQGTKLIKYFYYKALEENPQTDEKKFRYSGPIPQSKETAIVMIADTVEAMVRALKKPTAEDIKRTIKRAINLLKEEKQLQNSTLSEDELKKIEELLSELLTSYYHERIKYPEKPKEVRKL